jgi:hypothetical protein
MIAHIEETNPAEKRMIAINPIKFFMVCVFVMTCITQNKLKKQKGEELNPQPLSDLFFNQHTF